MPRGTPTVELKPAGPKSPWGAATAAWGEHLLDALPAACALFGQRDGLLVHANTAFNAVFGPIAHGVSLRDFATQFQCFDTPADEQHQGGFDLAALQDDPIDVFEAATGRWFSLRRSAIAWANGLPCSLVAMTDTTEHREALRARLSQREQLLFASRTMSVGEMATAMAHELNQPLAAVINYLNVGLQLLDRPAAGEQLSEALRLARSQAEHASGVIRHMREFVHSREPARDVHSLDSIVSHVAQLIQLETQTNRVRLIQRLADDLPAVRVDRVMIEQVMLNLLKNAIEAMRETPAADRRIVVTSRLTLDGDVEVRVADHGCGLSDTDEQRLFAPFFSTKADGFGVGLAICRSIVEYHSGRLYFERDPDGCTVFAIALPPA